MDNRTMKARFHHMWIAPKIQIIVKFRIAEIITIGLSNGSFLIRLPFHKAQVQFGHWKGNKTETRIQMLKVVFNKKISWIQCYFVRECSDDLEYTFKKSKMKFVIYSCYSTEWKQWEIILECIRLKTLGIDLV